MEKLMSGMLVMVGKMRERNKGTRFKKALGLQ